MVAPAIVGLTILSTVFGFDWSSTLEESDEQPQEASIGCPFNIADINSTIRQTVKEVVDETLKRNAAFSDFTGSRKTNDLLKDVKRVKSSEDNSETSTDSDARDIKRNRRLLREKKHKKKPGFARVLGGVETATNKFRYLVSIVVNEKHWCNGAIITHTVVITAAHCTNTVLPVASDPGVLGKRLKVKFSDTLFPVKSVIRHPFFELQPPPHYDVALLQLETDLNLNATSISPLSILISNDTMAPLPQSFIIVSGWGARKPSTSHVSIELQSARLKVRTQDYCVGSYHDVAGLYINENFMCASLFRNGTNRRDLCIFDGGTPAVQENKLHAILTFGPEDCAEGPPSVFVRLPPLLPWITKEIDKIEEFQRFIG